MPNNNLNRKVLSEGYCCLHGYVGLCRARGEKTKGMAENLAIPSRTIEHNCTQFKRGKLLCQRQSDCLLPIIATILQEAKGHSSS